MGQFEARREKAGGSAAWNLPLFWLLSEPKPTVNSGRGKRETAHWSPAFLPPGFLAQGLARRLHRGWPHLGEMQTALTLGVRSRTDQRRLLQPCELLQLADAGPRQRACVGVIGARWQLPEP
jgi:hypothetical protein